MDFTFSSSEDVDGDSYSVGLEISGGFELGGTYTQEWKLEGSCPSSPSHPARWAPPLRSADQLKASARSCGTNMGNYTFLIRSVTPNSAISLSSKWARISVSELQSLSPRVVEACALGKTAPCSASLG